MENSLITGCCMYMRELYEILVDPDITNYFMYRIKQWLLGLDSNQEPWR